MQYQIIWFQKLYDMKKIINVGIGGRSFVIDEDAYQELSNYLENFRRKTGMGYSTKEVMDEIEMRIAEIFSESLSYGQEVVNLPLVNKVIGMLGMPDGSENESYASREPQDFIYGNNPPKKLYRDTLQGSIGGVCAGLAHYAKLDLLLVRILMLISILFFSFGFWLYLILWIVVPEAKTAIEKCAMYGIPATAENLKMFHQKR